MSRSMINQRPQISVVIPAYNAELFIASTIESVLRQTFQDFEIWVIDDGSTDETAQLVQEFCRRDTRVKLVSQSNQGISATRQRGYHLSQGDYIAFLDADDRWLPENLATHMAHFAQKPQLGISFGRVAFMQLDGTPTGTVTTGRLQAIEPQHLFYENLLTTNSNAIVRREVFEQIGGFDRDLCGTEDQEFFLRACCYGWDVAGVEPVLVEYRITPGGLSSRLEMLEADWVRMRQKVQQYAPDLVKRHGHKSYAYFLRYIARRSLRVSQTPRLGIHCMNQALKADWTLILQEPRRTLLTLIAVYLRPVIPSLGA
jgi:glycosyltransferase involved in cell wall biosynthesis